MRNNQPVTNNEIVLRSDSLIVSKTNLKGQITYINKDFLEISGFSEAELIGEPHNVVRHPDMPVEAYEDLWRSLKDGRPWTGVVKNRCKNGDFYWVLATAAPIREAGGAVTGYISVRRKATEQQIQAAEGAYRQFREKRHGSRCIENGAVVSSALPARVARRFRDAAISSKMILVCLPLIFAIMVGTSLFLGRHIGTTIEATLIGELQQKLGLIRGMVDVRANAMRLEAIRLNDIFTGFFPEGFTIEPGGELPLLKSGKVTVNQRYDEIDRFSTLSGAVATVFVRKDEDFVRIATSVKNEKGERAIGTLLAQDHPGRSKLLSGERYVGRANLFGKDFYTSYTPIKRTDGQVIGATFIGVDVSAELAALRQQIKAVKIGETGYFYVIDARPGKSAGTLVVHPAKEGANILDTKDASGREFIKEMIEKKQGEIRYSWVNAELGETSPREKIVEFDTYPEWQWLIGGGSYLDEFDRVSRPTIHNIWLISLLVVFVLAVAIYILVNRLVRKPLQDEVLSAMTLLAGGKYDNHLSIARNDEIGKVMQGLQSMQIQQGFNVAESARVGNENQRIKTGLDCVSGNVRITDNDGRIIYLNGALSNTLHSIESEIRKQHPDFDASKVVGSDVGIFYEDSGGALQSMRELTTTRRSELLIGGRNMRVVTSPIVNDKGERLGSVGEWIDRTNELAVETEVGMIVAAAANGDFTQRVSIQGKEGFFLQLANDLNQLLDTSQRGLDEVVRMLGALAKGDLSKRIETDYAGTFGQLKNDANATAENLGDIVGQIKSAADAINTAAKEISSGNQDLSSRTEEQASSLEETASSMEQLTGTVRQNADNAKQANQLAGNAQQVAEKAGAVVGQVVGTMSAIHQSSSKISDIIGVIDGIAFQTNILALNAAVEAARAGEQGRGFAVVATEVRSLAQRSAAAAKEIKGLISDSVEKVEAGNKLVDQAGRTMEEVVGSIKGVARIMADIAEASGEQSAGIEQIGLAVNQMDEVTQQNAALVEEAAAAAESLEEQAQSLTKSVSVFRLSEHRHMPLPPARRETATLTDKSGRFGAQRSEQKAMPKIAASLDDEWHEF